MKCEELFTLLTDDNLKVKPQIVQIAKNSEGNINVIKTAVSSNTYIKDKLTVGSEVTGCYRWTTKMFSSPQGPLIYAANNYVIFTFPSGVSYTEEDYGVRSAFEVDKDFTVIPYNVNKFKTSDCFVIQGKAGGAWYDDLFFVSSVSRGLDSDGTVRKMLVGKFKSYDEVSFLSNDESLFNGLEKGDVLRLSADGRGRIVDISKMYSASSGYQSKMEVNYSGNASGFVKEIDAETKSILIDCNGKEYVFKSKSDEAFRVFLNDKKNKNVETVGFSDILENDFCYYKNKFCYYFGYSNSKKLLKGVIYNEKKHLSFWHFFGVLYMLPDNGHVCDRGRYCYNR